MFATLVIRDVQVATPRARFVQIDLGGAAFDYAPGQFVLVAPHGQPQRRPYSIASAPEDAKRSGVIDLLVGTDPISDGAHGAPAEGETTWNFDPAPGDRVDVEGPFGSFTFPESPAERRFLFVAGGTGIAPLRAMLRHALGIPHDRIGLFYSARTPDDFAFQDELRALAEAGAIDLRQTVTRDAGERWTGSRGRAKAESLRELVDGPETLCFVCGPLALVAATSTMLEALDIAPNRIRMEEWQ